MRKVVVTEAILGRYAGREISGPRPGQPLLRRGARIDADLLEAMQRRGIRIVWISDELLPEIEAPEAVKYETREAVRTAFSGAYDSAEAWQESKALPPPEHGLRIEDSTQMLVGEIANSNDVLTNLSFIRAWDDYTFEHSVQVAILSILIGKHLGMSEEALERLGTGAMLHDIGKALVPREILQKPGRLSDEEMEIMRQHPQLGWEFLHECFPHIMPTSSIVALQHHERLDGSGYPFGRRGPEIYLFSQIVAAADVYDALRAQRGYRSDFSPQQVYDLMHEDAGAKLRADAVEILLRHVALIPQGSVVQLSDGRFGMATKLVPGDVLHPMVLVVADEIGKPLPRHEIDLREEGLDVRRILDAWPAEVLTQVH
jgi:putative nucleotidyltransferase with HDIG domain